MAQKNGIYKLCGLIITIAVIVISAGIALGKHDTIITQNKKDIDAMKLVLPEIQQSQVRLETKMDILLQQNGKGK